MNNQRIIVSGLLTNPKGDVLLAKRAKTKQIAPGKWHLPGGHVEFGEDPDIALVREFKEEFNLAITVKQVARAFSYTEDEVHTVGITFTVETDEDLTKITLDPEDTEEIAWINKTLLASHLNEQDHDFITLNGYFEG